MATKAINAKSKRYDVRVPLELVEQVELLKLEDESTAQFVVAAIAGEIQRRLIKKKEQS